VRFVQIQSSGQLRAEKDDDLRAIRQVPPSIAFFPRWGIHQEKIIERAWATPLIDQDIPA
jgi:hypothetical protein